MVIIVGGVGSQPALGAGLTAVPSFVKAFDSHRIGLKELLDDVAVSMTEFTTQIYSSKSNVIVRPIDEKLRVSDAVVLFCARLRNVQRGCRLCGMKVVHGARCSYLRSLNPTSRNFY